MWWSKQSVELRQTLPRELTIFALRMKLNNCTTDWLGASFCYRWLAKDEDDGLIVRELPLGGTSLLNSTSVVFIYSAISPCPSSRSYPRLISLQLCAAFGRDAWNPNGDWKLFFFSLAATSYLVSVRTGDVRGAGTDANVFVQIFGAKGDTGKLQLRSAENTKNKFERSRTDQFVLEAVDIGKVGNDKGRNKQAQPLC